MAHISPEGVGKESETGRIDSKEKLIALIQRDFSGQQAELAQKILKSVNAYLFEDLINDPIISARMEGEVLVLETDEKGAMRYELP